MDIEDKEVKTEVLLGRSKVVIGVVSTRVVALKDVVVFEILVVLNGIIVVKVAEVVSEDVVRIGIVVLEVAKGRLVVETKVGATVVLKVKSVVRLVVVFWEGMVEGMVVGITVAISDDKTTSILELEVENTSDGFESIVEDMEEVVLTGVVNELKYKLDVI